MAELVYHLNAQVGSRSRGRNAVAAAAYRSGTSLEVTSERALIHGEAVEGKTVQDYTSRDAILAEKIMTPKGAPRWMRNRQKLWNAVEDSENRKDAQLFREIDVALPHMLPLEVQKQLLEGFIQQHFVSQGMIADYAIHGPTRFNDERNVHAHIMLTLRGVEGDGLAAKKNRDWNHKDNLLRWREAWASEVNLVLAANEETKADFVDHRSYKDRGIDQIPTRQLGTKKAMLERMGIRTDVGSFNEEARSYNVEKVLERLTEKQSVFQIYELRKALRAAGAEKLVKSRLERKRRKNKYTKAEIDLAVEAFLDKQIAKIKKADLVPLGEEGSGSLYTTKSIRATEEKQLTLAQGLFSRKGYKIKDKTISDVLEGKEWNDTKLHEDQEAALRYVCSEGGFKVVEGLAGSGKSFTMAAIRDVFQADGKRVVGLSHTNMVVQDLVGDGFKEAYTISKFLFDLDKPERIRTLRPPDKNTVLMVDEAAMLSLRQDGKLFDLVKKSKAKLVYVGDPRQLQSIEVGGMFDRYAKIADAEKLTTIVRQNKQWDRESSLAFADGNFYQGLLSYKRHAPDNIRPATDEEKATDVLVGDWIEDTRKDIGRRQNRFVFAYTNDQVQTLNSRIHQAEMQHGIIDPSTVQRFLCQTSAYDKETGKRVKLGFRSVTLGVNSRIQFTQTNKKLGVFNGAMGSVKKLQADGTVTVQLDKDGPKSDVITFNVNDFGDFDLGYAGTIYKGQGKTFDQTYVMFSHHWHRNASYVALTRSKAPTKLYYARNKVKSLEKLAKQMARLRTSTGLSLEFEVASDIANKAGMSQLRRMWLTRNFKDQAKKEKSRLWKQARDNFQKRSAKRDLHA